MGIQCHEAGSNSHRAANAGPLTIEAELPYQSGILVIHVLVAFSEYRLSIRFRGFLKDHLVSLFLLTEPDKTRRSAIDAWSRLSTPAGQKILYFG